MNKLTFLCLIFILFETSIHAQPLKINWQKSYGGSDADYGIKIGKTHNGFILFCTAYSNDGEVLGNHGSSDFWVVRIDTIGNIIWSKTYGGSYYDNLKQMKPTLDGGFVIIGHTFSTDGDVQGNHGSSDYWVIKIDSLGDLKWQTCLGGSIQDFGEVIDLAPDSGFICNGWSASPDGDVTGNHGLYDSWVVKLDKNGLLKWEYSFGSSYPDYGLGIASTDDGGAILNCSAGIADGDVQCNYHGGDSDVWIVKLDSLGVIEWQHCYGGSQHDFGNLIIPLKDGGYLCAGNTTSSDGDVSGNHGSFDIWVFTIDHFGNLLNQKCFGGSDDDTPDFMKQLSDSNYIIGGYTKSNDGDVSGNHGQMDIWVIKITPDLNLLWQQCFGGDDNEESFDMLDLGLGKYMLLGYTYTTDNSGDVQCHHWGICDAWLLSLTDTTYIGINNQLHSNNYLRVYPNPADQDVIFELLDPQVSSGARLSIFNDLGVFLAEFLFERTNDKYTWNTKERVPGLYFYQLSDKDRSERGKFLIKH